MTKKCNRLRGERPKAFWGALVGGAMNLIGSAISSKSQARAIRRQIEAQKEAARTQLELANNSNLASTLNSYATATRSYNDEDDYNLKYRLGGNKRLGSNRIYITDGGNATKIANDTYLLRGGSHEQTNETGQTGIGINVGGNEVEAEGGEVAQKKNGALRIFSAQPILGNGMSPAQAILRGYNKDKVFSQQQAFKKRNGLKDDGSKAAFGDLVTGTWNFLKQHRSPITNLAALAAAYQRFYPNSNYNKQKGKFGSGKGFNGSGAGGTWTNVKPATRKFNNFNDAYDDAVNRGASTFKFGNKLYNTKAEGNPIREINNRAVGSYRDTIMTNDRGKNYGVDFGPIKGPATLIPLVYDTYDRPRKRHRLGGGLTSKDRGSSKHPYPSVSSKDFAGGGRSYPIPTKADAVDALRLAGLHGRSDVKAKVYSRYPELRKKVRGGAKIEPYYDWARNTSSNLDISFIDPTYDYRTYYNSVTPYERALIRFAPQGTHFTDIGKTPKHPTFSNESKYSNAKTPGGTWNGNVFVPNIWQFGNNGNNRRNKYMNNSGEGYFNGRIDVFPTSRKKHSLGGRTQFRNGGTWVKPVYNTSKYRGTSRARKQIAKWEGSDFAGQNAQFKGDAIGAKERELRQFMGKAYNYLNDNQRDALLSYYYNVVPKSFRGQMTKYRNALINAQTEQEYNDTLNNMRESINIGANRKGMSGLRNRRAIERNWFGYTTPMNTNKTRAILKQQDDAKLVQPTDNTRIVVQPQYIEVPAPVGHGIVPVDNPDPNLLQGNIKDNLINMGNKFRLGQRCGGSTRVRKSLGGESRPVKGMRRKLTWGDVTYPYRRNNNFDYWDIIDQEQKVNDKGGISPWTTSNNYDVKVPYAITKSTPTIPYTSKVSTPTSGISENKTIPTYIGNKSGMIIRDADWYGLGADLVSSIGGSILGLGAYKNLDFDYNLPNFVEESPVALNTTYHNEAQKSNVERNRLNNRNSILRNTMSGSTAVGRMQGVDTNALYQLNQLADEKTNKETELMNQNLLNEQQVRARNAAARNQYYNTVASIKNAAIQAKNEAELAKGQILSGSLQGIGNSFQNFISQGRQNYDDTQAMLMGVAASDYATPSRLLELGVDVGDDAALAGIYRSAMNVPNPGARPKREDYSDNTEYSYALTRWENQNKAYQRRNSYADLIKGRMSKKNLIKYGII